MNHRRRDVAEAARVVAPVAADQADAVAALVRQHPPAVDLLLVDPAVAVEGLADERGGPSGRTEGASDRLERLGVIAELATERLMSRRC
jgi:hypothetical protein